MVDVEYQCEETVPLFTGRMLTLPFLASSPASSSGPTQRAEEESVLLPMALGDTPSIEQTIQDTHIGNEDLSSTASPLPSENTSAQQDETATPPEVLDRASVRDYMLTHSLIGSKSMKQRIPFVGELTPFTSPSDPEVPFQIRRMNTRQVMAYRDANAKVRYIMQDGDDTITTEKDFPMGSVQLQVIELGLAGWNITDSAGVVVPINRETILTYLEPEEFTSLYGKVMELNPILSGETTRKNS